MNRESTILSFAVSKNQKENVVGEQEKNTGNSEGHEENEDAVVEKGEK